MAEWARAELNRHQGLMLAPSLDEQLGAQHGVRVLDAMLLGLDWSEWEAQYARQSAGRPAIHPRLMAGAILYGLMKRIRSTRELEEATRMRLDFRWFLDGMTVDHTTFCVFRKLFGEKIGELFKQLNRQAVAVRKATLEEIVIDGTRVRADSDRHGARTAEALQKRLTVLEEQIAQGLVELGEEEESVPDSRHQLEQRLQQLEAQKQKLTKALAVAQERDESKRRADGEKAVKVRVPVTDPDAHLMPNKEGGYAPNYTPVVAVDAGSGLIMAAEVADGNAEAASVAPMMEQVDAVAPAPTKRVLFDGGFGTGSNLKQLSEDGVEVYAPAGVAGVENPALRPDPSVAVAEDLRATLPLHGDQLDRAAFIYDPAHDCYRCPMGQEMPRFRTVSRQTREGTRVAITEYHCRDCSGCPLAKKCLRGQAKVRMITRDQYEPLREDLAARMQTEQGRTVYARRAPIVEGVFARIKATLGIRRFACRGKEKVAYEWLWICTAYNLMTLIRTSGKAAPKQPTAPQPSTRVLRCLAQLVRLAWKSHFPCPKQALPAPRLTQNRSANKLFALSANGFN